MRHLFALLVVALWPALAEAQTDSATLNAAFTGLARLSFSANSITFVDADPDFVPQVSSSPATITISTKARASSGGTVTLSVQASDDLRSGVATIPASHVTWTVSGAGFLGGTLSATAAQTVATWTGSGVRSGTQSFYFRNLWTHPTGTYTLTMLYTLSAA
ncbi:MAG: hypothetical protein A3H96_17255 [Acidobacteria bacterium RIFCSPLOWO2_02_FULL_67_36]|nr:MAG: hypothetical protein A3H96_17255 [Acidobacteria bacterium RIFCSPLOWO2_02_FULL_67_36]OFW25763.1 MAG: hypothetical protein A3G21_25140 [Acidobacteria bacterium RIFCSPLOWO2_12_FULL_66_21]